MQNGEHVFETNRLRSIGRHVLQIFAQSGRVYPEIRHQPPKDKTYSRPTTVNIIQQKSNNTTGKSQFVTIPVGNNRAKQGQRKGRKFRGDTPEDGLHLVRSSKGKMLMQFGNLKFGF